MLRCALRVLAILVLTVHAGTAVAQTAIWTKRTPKTSPPVRYLTAMASDHARGRVVLFGGAQNLVAALQDTWEWDGAEWTEIKPLHKPIIRYGHGMAYDEVRKQVVLFGGVDATGAVHNDTWIWDGKDWTQLAPKTSPPARAHHSIFWHAGLERLAIYGGEGNFNRYSDLWSWDGTTWRQEKLDPVPFSNAYRAVASHDASRDRLVVYSSLTNTLWTMAEWDGEQWHTPSPLADCGRRSQTPIVYDPVRHRTVVACGYQSKGSTPMPDDTWEWDGAGWVISPSTTHPFGRYLHALAWDGARGEIVLFGGYRGGDLNETWVYGPSIRPVITTDRRDGRDHAKRLAGDVYGVTDVRAELENAAARACLGTAADGCSRVVLRITVPTSGAVTVKFKNPDGRSGRETGVLRDPLTMKPGVFSPTSVTVTPDNENLNGAYHAWVVYRAPACFARPNAGDENNRTRDVALEVTQGTTTHDTWVRLTRPTVICALGDWRIYDSPKQNFGSLSTRGIYPGFTLAFIDSANAELVQSMPEIRAGLITAEQEQRDHGFVACRVDWLGYDRGGLLARYYYRRSRHGAELPWRRPDNFGGGDIHRLILMYSPQWGMPWADALARVRTIPEFTAVDEVLPLVPRGVFADLRSGSRVLEYIGETPLPTRVMLGVGFETEWPAAGVPLADAPAKLADDQWKTLVRAMGWFTTSTTKAVFETRRHDGVVIEESALGGLDPQKYATIFDSGGGVRHSGALGTTEHPNEMKRLLDTPVEEYAPNVPAPDLKPPGSASITPVRPLTDRLEITVFPAGPKVKPHELLWLEVVGKSGFTPEVVDIFYAGTWTTLSQSPFKYTLQIAADAIHQAHVLAFARDASGKVAIASLVRPVEMPSNVTQWGVSVSAGTTKLAGPDERARLRVAAMFNDVHRDVTQTRTGTVYATAPAGIVSVDALGVAHPIRQGRTVITARHGGYSDTVTIDVAYPPVKTYGIGVRGTAGYTPILGSGGETPTAGNSAFKIVVSGVRGGAPGVGILSLAAGDAPFLGGHLLVDPGQGFFMVLLADGTSGQPGAGTVTIPTPLPAGSAWVGLTTYFQAGFLDPQAPYSWSLTNGLAVTITE